MDEAQGFDVLLKSAGYVVGVAPKAWANKLVGNAPQHGVGIG